MDVRAFEKIGIEESQWRNDPEALADWAKWIESIEPVDFGHKDSFDEEFRLFNIEAVRRQFEAGIS